MATSKDLANLLETLEKKYKDPEKTVEKFLAYAKRKNLDYKLPNVVKHVERRAKNRTDNKLMLTVAQDISPEMERDIRKSIGVGEDVVTQKKVDPKIIGGFVAEYNNFVYDGSILGQIKRLQEDLLKN